MRSLKENLVRYLAALTGEQPSLVAQPVARLPLFLRQRYELNAVQLFGRRFLLALENNDHEPATPGEYETQSRTLGGHLGEPVVLVLAALQSYARNRMVQKGVPFIVPGSQVFLPTAVIDLRERRKGPMPAPGKKLPPAAQCLVLYQLVREPLEESPLAEVAHKIGYSPIMLTKVKTELEAARLCESVQSGRSTHLRFLFKGEALWTHALPLLSPPQRARRWVQWALPPQSALLAGVSALARRTMIQEDTVPTYALWHKSYVDLLKDSDVVECHDREDATACVELWNYDPRTLGDTHAVDPLSLYLSLQGSADERIQQQLERLIEEMSW